MNVHTYIYSLSNTTVLVYRLREDAVGLQSNTARLCILRGPIVNQVYIDLRVLSQDEATLKTQEVRQASRSKSTWVGTYTVQ